MALRLFVKNFPKDATESKIRDFFSTKGTVTDVALKFTSEGKFRRFGFIGFASSNEAEEAQKYFDKTFMGTSRLHVELSKDLAQKPRPWSKYSEESTAYLKSHPEEAKEKVKELQEAKLEKQRMQRLHKEKKDFLKDVFGDALEDDEKFREFLAVNQSEKLVWTNDEAEEQRAIEETSREKNDTNEETKSKLPKEIYTHVVVIRNLSFKWKRRDVKDFFKGLSVCSIRKCLRPGVKGVAYVAFETEEDLLKALELDKCFMQRRRVHVLKYIDRSIKHQEKSRPSFKDKEVAPDVIADTGRLFIRNLPYTATEEELESLFKPFGPIAELHLSIDSITKKPKGFAFVSFIFPEHAVKAHQALDYTTFHGRLLHIIPGIAKQEDPDLSKEGTSSSFKTEKQAKLKAQSGNVHSWNSLFLGSNAVADVMSKKYFIDKMHLLGAERGENVAVRMALGETQIVNETREFLEKHGVDLSVFKQNITERSKSIILVKNLPANTKETTLWDLFDQKKKCVRRIVIPPSGVTALVEFIEPQDARSAFKRLAYTLFMDRPLYLEWAPVNVFNKEAPAENSESMRPPSDGEDESTTSPNNEISVETTGEISTKELEDSEPEEGSLLFVKNLNFSTTNEVLHQHFSQCANVVRATVATKADPHRPGSTLSMGYGFVQFTSKEEAMKSLKKLQHSTLESHTLELKVSRREVNVAGITRREQKLGKASTKILVRNVPFQANRKEIFDLFVVFGELKTVRLPKKMFGNDCSNHRGFAFVEFATKSDAKRAFESLCHSTHLYGRRLVLEWAEEEEQDVDVLRRKTAEKFLGEPARKRLKKSDLKDTLEGTDT